MSMSVVPAPVIVALLIVAARSEGVSCAESELMSCPTTITASTTIGVSLVQSISLNRRITGAETKDSLTRLEQGVDRADLLEQGELGTALVEGNKATESVFINASNAHELAFLRESVLSAETGATTNSALANKIVDKALARLTEVGTTMLQDVVKVFKEGRYHRHYEDMSEESRRTAGMLVLVVLILLILGACYLCLTRPEPTSLKTSHYNANSPRVGLATRSPALSARQVPHQGARMGTAFSPTPDTQQTLPRHMGSAASSEDEGRGDDRFCPDLVVPQQCECILVVPVYAPSGHFNICDMNGRAVLHASTQTGGPGALWQLALQTATGEPLAHCTEVRQGSAISTTAGAEFHILDAKAEYFASLVSIQGQQRFQLTTQTGKKLQLWGNFQTQAVNVTDEQGGLLATTEFVDFENQTGIFYRLRVAPLANVGHSLCALLCIGQILRASGGHSPAPIMAGGR